MQSLSFAFLVIIYFLSVNINCDTKWTVGPWNGSQVAPLGVRNLTLPLTQFEAAEDGAGALEVLVKTPEEKEEDCLNNLEECFENDLSHKNVAVHLSQLFYTTTSPFDLSHTPGVSPACRRQSQQYIDDLKRFKLWALKMYDSTAKLPSGILNGNVNQLGDFDLCLQANEASQKIRGQYCLASMQVGSPASPYVSALHRLAQSHFHIKSNLNDPGHRVPRFSSINWALCVPSACSSRDVELGLKKNILGVVDGTGFQFRVKVDPGMCQSVGEEEIPKSTVIAALVFIGVALFVTAAALYDYVAVGKKNEWIMAFSLRKNLCSMVSTKRSSDDIKAIHGIRFLNAVLLILAHKSMALFFVPYINRTEMVEYIARPWSVIGRAASLYTDPFIMISGTLTTYSLLGKLQRTNRINVFEEYASRLFRIVPTFAALIAFCTFVLPWLNSGPMWNLVVTEHSTICKRNWWRNLLFIHNYFGFKDMCLTHTHHMGIDTQLFFVSPFLVLLVWKWPKKGSATLMAVAVVSTIMRYYVTYTMKLSNYIHFGTSIQQLFETADHMYILPVHRATVYVMGIFLGYILRNFRTTSLSNAQLRVGNTLALLSFFAAFFGPAFMGSIQYKYNATDAAWYAAFAPIFWCFAFAWLIFRAHTGRRSPFEQFFSWPGFSVWTKISYAVYLTQFPVFFYNVGTARTAEHYGFFRMMLNVKEYFWVVVMAATLTLLFEAPFQNVKNLIFRRPQKETGAKVKVR